MDRQNWGGPRPGSGRKVHPDIVRTRSKSITLYQYEWDRLAEEAEDNSATKEAARRIRASMKQ